MQAHGLSPNLLLDALLWIYRLLWIVGCCIEFDRTHTEGSPAPIFLFSHGLHLTMNSTLELAYWVMPRPNPCIHRPI